MDRLRPTVKRDLTLFSLQAWQSGYYRLKQTLGWRYPIIFYYDGQKVNFYHRLKDFDYFKNAITEKVIKNDAIFDKLNKQFQFDVEKLKKLAGKIQTDDWEKVFNLIGKAMSFYVFAVSDDFVGRRPAAWKSRKMSEGILYEIDSEIEKSISKMLKKHGLDKSLAHYLSKDEAIIIKKGEQIDISKINCRKDGYIVDGNNIITDMNFSQYCQKNQLINSEDDVFVQKVKIIKGNVAYPGMAMGTVKKIFGKNDFKKVKDGDIMVSIMTNINFLPVMKKSAAIITDEGGITCHAAIISRELQIPCIIGTKIATRILKDGDVVEVDANKGIVKKLT